MPRNGLKSMANTQMKKALLKTETEHDPEGAELCGPDPSDSARNFRIQLEPGAINTTRLALTLSAMTMDA